MNNQNDAMPSQNLNFGQAIEALKKGKNIARAGWNGKGMFVFLNPGSVDKRSKFIQGTQVPVNDSFIDGVNLSLFNAGDEGTNTRLPNLNMRAASGSTVTGWLASQTDILAEDWQIA